MSSSSASPLNRPPPAVPEHELLKRIGGGSYGEVWLVRNLTTKTYRALKVVYRDRFDGQRSYERELRGIRHFEPISRTHPGLVDILQVGQNDKQGFFYYVMELADAAVKPEGPEKNGGKCGVGRDKPKSAAALETTPAVDQDCTQESISPANYSPRTLHSEIQRRDRDGRMPVQECLAWGNSLAEAVAYLHRQGLLHRDIKPGNVVFIDGQPKLADIGLVASVGEAGSFVGTRGFIPPEGHISARSDVFSFGRLLYECAWGKDRLEFPAVPPDAADWPDHPALLELNEVILKACDHDPERRYGSVEELQTDLLWLQQGRSLRRLHRIEGRLKHWARAGVAVSLVAALALGGWLYQHRQSERFQQLADANRQQLARSYVGNGMRLLEEGDYLASLVWLMEALKLETGDPLAEQAHRRRIGSVLRQCPKLVAMGAHAKRIYYAEFSRDGQQVVTASADHTARVWRAATGEPITAPLRHDGDVEMAVFSPDGTQVATCSHDGTARMWDAHTGRLLHSPLRHESRVTHIAFSPDGGRLVTTAAGGAQLWEAETGKAFGNSMTHDGKLRMAGFSRDGRWVLTASYDHTARIWDARTAQPVSPPLLHPDVVMCAEASPDGKLVATACQDDRVRLWDASTWQPETLPVPHSGQVRYVMFSADGRRLASSGGELSTLQSVPFTGEAMVWDVATRRLLFPPLRHLRAAQEANFSADGQLLLTASSDDTVRLWDASTGEPVLPVLRLGSSLRNALFSPEGRRIVTSGQDELWRVWDLSGTAAAVERTFPVNGMHPQAVPSPDGEFVATSSSADPALLWMLRSSSQPRTLIEHPMGRSCFSPDGHQIAIADTNGVGRIFEVATGQTIGPAMQLPPGCALTEFSSDGRLVVAAGGSIAQVWNTETHRAVTPLLLHRYSIVCTRLSPDGRYLAIGTGNPGHVKEGELHVWLTATGQPAIPSMVIDGSAESLAFSPDGRHLAFGCVDFLPERRDAMVIVPAEGGRVALTLPHPTGVYAVAYSPDGSRIVTGGKDGVARVWDAASGRLLAQTTPQLGGVFSVAVGGGGTMFATAGMDRRARLWEMASASPLTAWLPHFAGVRDVHLTSDGLQLLTSGARQPSGEIRLWNVSPTTLPLTKVESVIGALSGSRFDPTRGLVPLPPETILEHWKVQQKQGQDPFVTSQTDLLRWHQLRATVSEQRREWSAARFHLAELGKIQANDPETAKRRSKAAAKLGQLSLLP